jgi:hypothetical protein
MPELALSAILLSGICRGSVHDRLAQRFIAFPRKHLLPNPKSGLLTRLPKLASNVSRSRQALILRHGFGFPQEASVP